MFWKDKIEDLKKKRKIILWKVNLFDGGSLHHFLKGYFPERKILLLRGM